MTCEYPPQIGGVSDYTKLVALGLAEAGDEVHVWAPPAAEGGQCEGHREKGEEQRAKNEGSKHESSCVTHHSSRATVHRELGKFRPSDLRRAGKQLDRFPAPRRLLVQWVPHGYGYLSMNLPFCFWLWRRAKLKGDIVELMVHEPYLTFGEGSWEQSAVAFVHRLMTLTILNSASCVWMSIPAWESRLRPYALGRRVAFEWIPIPSSVPVVADGEGVRAARSRYACNGNLLVGHFGTGEPHIKTQLLVAITALFRKHPDAQLLFMGRGSDLLINELTDNAPELAGKIRATGWLPLNDLSLHISACDLMLQPYPDGISSRRTSAMAGLSHGVPLITTTGHLTEPLWAASNAVALAPLDGISDLPALTANLLSDSSERERMGTVAKRLYSERFDIRHTIAALRAGRT